MHAKDVAYTREGVLGWRVVLTLVTIRGCLAITQDLSFTLVGLRILIFTGGILPYMGEFRFAAGFLAVISDWVEPDCQLWCEVMLQAWLRA